MNSKLLVTGAGGFIGQHLCLSLTQKGHKVIGIDLHYPENSEDRCRGQLRQVESDYRNWDLLKGLLRDVDVIFHLASAHLQVSLPESEYWDINVNSLRPLMNLALQSGVRRFVHVSSVGVYGDLGAWPADENSPCFPQSVYGKTKLAGEAEVAEFGHETGFPAVILRPSWVYGPGCPRTLKIYRTLKKRHFVMIGSGRNLRHPLYIEDMLLSFSLAMESDSAVGETFVIGGERAITTAELIGAFCKILDLPRPQINLPMNIGKMIASGSEIFFGLFGKEPLLSTRSLEFFHTNNSFNISKARERLGFAPRYTFEEGLAESQQWLFRKV